MEAGRVTNLYTNCFLLVEDTAAERQQHVGSSQSRVERGAEEGNDCLWRCACWWESKKQASERHTIDTLGIVDRVTVWGSAYGRNILQIIFSPVVISAS